MKIPLLEYFASVSAKEFPLLSYRVAPAEEFALLIEDQLNVKENQEKDKIGSKPDKNEKRGEAGKSLKQLQWVEEEKLSKTQKEWPKTQTLSKTIQIFKERRKEKGPEVQLIERSKKGIKTTQCSKW
nr:hypothetical protein [Tanacetum cinerariifolium]